MLEATLPHGTNIAGGGLQVHSPQAPSEVAHSSIRNGALRGAFGVAFVPHTGVRLQRRGLAAEVSLRVACQKGSSPARAQVRLLGVQHWEHKGLAASALLTATVVAHTKLAMRLMRVPVAIPPDATYGASPRTLGAHRPRNDYPRCAVSPCTAQLNLRL